jgi:hypothetical protein
MYPGGIPEPDSLGFIPVNDVGHHGDFEEAIALICQILQREPVIVDEAGYKHEITAASVDTDQSRFAWVECHSKVYGPIVDVRLCLNAMVDGRRIIDWEIETYNPFFGCQIELFLWMSDSLIVIYHEKHSTYICSFDVQPRLVDQSIRDRPITRYKIADEWRVRNRTVIYRSDVMDMVERMSLPSLQFLEPWTLTTLVQ